MSGTDKCILEGLSDEQSEMGTYLIAMPSMHTYVLLLSMHMQILRACGSVASAAQVLLPCRDAS